MKNIILILFFFPALANGQQDSKTKSIFIEKLEKCNVTIAGKYHNKDTIPLTAFQNTVFLKTDCGVFLGCDIYFSENGSCAVTRTDGPFQLTNAFLLPSTHPNYSTIIILNIRYKTDDGQMHVTKGITVTVKKQ